MIITDISDHLSKMDRRIPLHMRIELVCYDFQGIMDPYLANIYTCLALFMQVVPLHSCAR